jgi:hypothetical protein
VVLGAASEFSLVLPDASPTRSHLYAPRSVLLDPDGTGRVRVIAADTGNHRLMVWPDVPDADGADCAQVIGQPNATGEGPQAGGRGPERGLHLPTGLARVGDLLIVADGWNHRLVGYDLRDLSDDPAPIWWLGQPDLSGVQPNAGSEPTGSTFYWPFGVFWDGAWFWVADTGNRRVLGWRGLPEKPDSPADLVLGQSDAAGRGENRDDAIGPSSFRWPHALAIFQDVLWVADGGNHRVLGWRLPLHQDRPADLVLGQPDFVTARELPHVPQGPSRLRFPYAVAATGDQLIVADTANNRLLAWTGPDAPAGSSAAAEVLGQNNFDSGGENRWTAVAADTLCWPYGLSTSGTLLAVADSGNNRVVIWERGAS